MDIDIGAATSGWWRLLFYVITSHSNIESILNIFHFCFNLCFLMFLKYFFHLIWLNKKYIQKLLLGFALRLLNIYRLKDKNTKKISIFMSLMSSFFLFAIILDVTHFSFHFAAEFAKLVPIRQRWSTWKCDSLLSMKTRMIVADKVIWTT